MKRMLIAAGLALACFVGLDMVSIAYAQDAVVAVAPTQAADAGPWNQFWLQLQPALATFALAVLGALGTIVTYFASKFGNAQTTKAITAIYMTGVEAAAGWLQHKLIESGADAAKAVSVDSPEVASAVDYFRASFPKDKVQPPDHELARDIVAVFGKLFPRFGALLTVGEAVIGGLAGPKR